MQEVFFNNRTNVMASSCAWVLFSLLIIFWAPPLISSNPLNPFNHQEKSDFRLINRRALAECSESYPHLSINISPNSSLPNEINVTVTVSGVTDPDELDWVAMITPSNSSVSTCNSVIDNSIVTGDFTPLPFLCHYSVKAQYMKTDPFYLSCMNKTCHRTSGDDCVNQTCSGSIMFHIINFRTDIEFVFFSGGFENACLIKRSSPIQFGRPAMPLYGHLSSMDSTGTSMKLTWISGDGKSQEVRYGFEQRSASSNVITFSQDDMCDSYNSTPSAATDFGWHHPGYIHSAVMTGLKPSQTYEYRYGSDSIGWSDMIKFNTPPAGGSNNLSFLIYGDMGKAPLDPSIEHYIQPGSVSVAQAIGKVIEKHTIDSIFHIGDISYATGFLVEWDYFLHSIQPFASHVSYMTAIGNHESNFAGPKSKSWYNLSDSGGECGVPYESYFQMPTCEKDKQWYSIEQGPVHFTVASTEFDWTQNSTQFEWIKGDLSSVNRTETPWLIFIGHRPMYSSNDGLKIFGATIFPTVDVNFRNSIEPLLLNYKVDLAIFGHIHNYERTCAVFQDKCKGMPLKSKDGIDVYDNNNYTAPVHVMAGMAGFTLDDFPDVKTWSLARFQEFGFGGVRATKTDLLFVFVNSTGMEVRDTFRIIKNLF
ncbi:hypothetical protein LUZ60_004245 [Juncus effusus]|nr:hypothetical protein LUZ60_004245 [Juncus effusus]